ncbi:MAG: imidazole glycerol phosphate synthase subunit HisH [Pseudomonadota bacterium]
MTDTVISTPSSVAKTAIPVVAIVDYGSGNLRSAEKSFQRMAARPSDITVTDNPDLVSRADRLVIPGVGAFAECRSRLMAIDGMVEAIEEAVDCGTPVLGICVGMQLMASRGLEHGETRGFGWIPGDVVLLEPDDTSLKVPHMGWNELTFGAHPLLKGIEQGAHAYFVHSYHLATDEHRYRIAETDYGGPVTAAVANGNVAGTQFHPEKSQTVGLQLIDNFLDWTP